MLWVLFAFLVAGLSYTEGLTVSVPVKLLHSWHGGFNGEIKIPLQANIRNGWKVTIEFSLPVRNIQVWDAVWVSTSGNGRVHVLKNQVYNPNLQAGSTLTFSFLGTTDGTAPTGVATFTSSGEVINPPTTTSPRTTTTTRSVTNSPTTTAPTPPPSGSGAYDYAEVLHKSILFYEAQRSGKLPGNNRIAWRGDSALKDGSDKDIDLTGGWYDAGDHVKFNFPMAFSVTVLSWGILQYGSAYQSAGELQNVLDSIKWPLDYFIKCHTKSDELWGQVGKGSIDHGYWGRAENMEKQKIYRPSYKIDHQNPGSDLAAETAAAMAAGAMVFQEYGGTTYAAYAEELLRHAEELYSFADRYRGKYSDSISDAAGFYNSYAFEDELMWGAIWLYKATGDRGYLTKAEQQYNSGQSRAYMPGFSWDDKKAGAYVLLYEATKQGKYKDSLENYLNLWLHSSSVTPKGLVWALEWASNRYAASTAFIALVAADQGVFTRDGRNFARTQIHYMLGDAGRSFVVGFGHNPPQRAHHRGASCTQTYCVNEHSSDPNPNVLEGALVGGPGRNDEYADVRNDYRKNEVACDYNAGFQSAVAGLMSLS